MNSASWLRQSNFHLGFEVVQMPFSRDLPHVTITCPHPDSNWEPSP